ncbi:hypothetical protein HPP92_014413 [Vanilla planifolia]|uniref:Methyltransferase n=1 Tax=Vanilla planifolia TaxID=51239 RepID=A0A835UUU1_VANPL|nr:hypothetical protein HPP92_014413 [Vanilla planifolia]
MRGKRLSPPPAGRGFVYRMKNKDAKPGSSPDKTSRAVPMILMFILLGGLSFYLGGIFCSERNMLLAKVSITKTLTQKENVAAPLLQSIRFPDCGIDYQDYTPCTDPRRWRRYGNFRLSFMERHCPPINEREECLVPPPAGKYVDLMEYLIPEMKDGTVRTAIDTGCGVASWGGDLLDRGILALSLAPRDNHEAQVQFALERGIPAILGIISTQRLPFPSNSFDMAHCSRCLIPWTEFDGLYLLEIHRILRPGGFWVLSGPPINYKNRWRGWNTTIDEQKKDFEDLKKLLTSMCFKLYNMKDDIAVWQKSTDIDCYNQLTLSSYPPKCDDSRDPDSAWYIPLRPCITAPNQNTKILNLTSTPKWPERLNESPERVSMVPSGSDNVFKHDQSKWNARLKHYKKLLPSLGGDKFRNVMDMNTLYGGFAAALIGSPLWVMNVVSSYGINSLGIIYDRGLIGAYHDWCEPFSTYPRTYDLLHLDGLFTAESHRCEMKYVLLEMDRILRPSGHVIIRETSFFVDAISTIAKDLKWSCEKQETEQNGKEKLLICQKKLWYSKVSRG